MPSALPIPATCPSLSAQWYHCLERPTPAPHPLPPCPELDTAPVQLTDHLRPHHTHTQKAWVMWNLTQEASTAESQQGLQNPLSAPAAGLLCLESGQGQ